MNQALLAAPEEVAARIPEIPAARQYWFIRTNGGLFYEGFLRTGSVGIGYNYGNPDADTRRFCQKQRC